MEFLDQDGLKWLTSLIKNYVGINWSMDGDTKDVIIGSSNDLNNYTTVGNYYCRPDSVAATISNSPTDTSFIIKVYSGESYNFDTSDGNLTQYLENDHGVSWRRYKSGNTWSGWECVFTVDNDSVGSGTNPIHISDGKITSSAATVGSNTRPVYLSSGTLTASSSGVGSSSRPIYLSSGTLTQSTGSVGSGTRPVYLSSGTITQQSSTVGSSTKPIYLNAGTLTASSSSVGGSARGTYLSSGKITASSSTVGSGTQPVYLNSGTITALNTTVGSSSEPIYLKSGVFTSCGSMGNANVTDYKTGESGYVKFAMGLIIQWGSRNTTGSNDDPFTITFPISFTSSSSYVIMKCTNASSQMGPTDSHISIWSKTKSTAVMAEGYGDNPSWIAVGY